MRGTYEKLTCPHINFFYSLDTDKSSYGQQQYTIQKCVLTTGDDQGSKLFL